jgi:hypothetical protein
VDVDTISAWPWEKFRRWMLADEVAYMADRIRGTQAGANMSEKDVYGIIQMEQAAHDWVGLLPAGD